MPAPPDRKCTAPGCYRTHYSKGLCRRCYDRRRRDGLAEEKQEYLRREARRCSEGGCTGLAAAKGMCRVCYERNRRAQPGFAEAERLRLANNPTLAERKRQQNREAYHRHIEKRRAYDHARYAARREAVRATPAPRKTCKTPPEQIARNAVRGRFRRTGWSADSVAEALERQGSCCAICHASFTKQGLTRMNADHWEPEGVKTPRELLCTACNTGLGFYEKGPRKQGLRFAAFEDYLTKHGAA